MNERHLIIIIGQSSIRFRCGHLMGSDPLPATQLEIEEKIQYFQNITRSTSFEIITE